MLIPPRPARPGLCVLCAASRHWHLRPDKFPNKAIWDGSSAVVFARARSLRAPCASDGLATRRDVAHRPAHRLARCRRPGDLDQHARPAFAVAQHHRPHPGDFCAPAQVSLHRLRRHLTQSPPLWRRILERHSHLADISVRSSLRFVSSLILCIASISPPISGPSQYHRLISPRHHPQPGIWPSVATTFPPASTLRSTSSFPAHR